MFVDASAPSELYFETFYLQCLAQASYIVAHNGWAFLIDPRRDVDLYLQELGKRGLRLKGVLLTHLHAGELQACPEYPYCA